MINPNLVEARLGGGVIFSGSYDLQNKLTGNRAAVQYTYDTKGYPASRVTNSKWTERNGTV
jgi:hypothetical protein